jgi:hypothetical protein
MGVAEMKTKNWFVKLSSIVVCVALVLLVSRYAHGEAEIKTLPIPVYPPGYTAVQKPFALTLEKTSSIEISTREGEIDGIRIDLTFKYSGEDGKPEYCLYQPPFYLIDTEGNWIDAKMQWKNYHSFYFTKGHPYTSDSNSYLTFPVTEEMKGKELYLVFLNGSDICSGESLYNYLVFDLGAVVKE